jgi:hypothetical protein
VGGIYHDTGLAGVFSAYIGNAPGHTGVGIGFRAAL